MSNVQRKAMDGKQVWRELRKLLDIHPGTGGTQRLEELVLSLYDGEGYSCDLARVIGELDPKRFDLVLALLRDYYERGESEELLELGRQIIEERRAIKTDEEPRPVIRPGLRTVPKSFRIAEGGNVDSLNAPVFL